MNFTGQKLEKLENDFRVREVQKTRKFYKLHGTSRNFTNSILKKLNIKKLEPTLECRTFLTIFHDVREVL